MDIDQRLDKLAERHEALTQSVELIARMQQKNEEAHQKNEVLLAHVMESIDSLNSTKMRGSDVSDRYSSDMNRSA